MKSARHPNSVPRGNDARLSMKRDSPKALLIGDGNRAEMAPIVAWLEQRTSETTLRRFARPSDLSAELQSEWRPDLIVVLEAHPDEYCRDDVAGLFAAAPIARIVCCAGAWSESAGRTRRIWPPALRVSVATALPRLELEWTFITDEFEGDLLLPTASREEWFASHHPAVRPCRSGSMTVAVISPDAEYRSMLSDVLEAAGLTVERSADADAQVIVWDVDPWSERQAELLRRRLKCSPASTVVAVSGWMTPDMESDLARLQVRAALPKLGDVGRLVDCIADLDFSRGVDAGR